MNFEEALTAELETISGLENKVYPLLAIDGAVAPFLIYRLNTLEIKKKTLSGMLDNKYSGTYDLTLVAVSYSDLKTKSNLIVEKLFSFLFREIGTGGPTIQNLSVRQIGDLFEPEPRLYRADFQIDINY